MGTLPDSGRIAVDRIIGSGSFGAVYLAWDEDRQQAVALKRLTRVSAEGVFRFKQEFRLLADMNHPNLAELYDLFSDQGRFSFTMEYVDGQPFAAWVRNEREALAREPTARGQEATFDATRSGARDGSTWADAPAPDPDPAPVPRAAPDRRGLTAPDRLAAALVQLVAGIRALHGSGKLHLDLKSNNVLVTPEGRVVILDFGLAREHAPAAMLSAGAPTLQGTPSHLAPEIAQGLAATEASDWYGVGVMIYQCLTGELPFQGTAMEMIRAKVVRPAPSPLAVCADLPADLVALCAALLDRDPSRRPDGAGILAALGSSPMPAGPGRSGPLIGRERELDTLRTALAEARRGQLRTVLLQGGSGLGKSFLLRRFLQETGQRLPEAMTLLGRCFEQDSVPFKGMDDLVDALSAQLRQLPPEQMEALLPARREPLARLFPVLRQVPAFARASHRDGAPGTAQDVLRRQAFLALRELIARLARSRPLVLALDDFQWADRDTAALLLDLVRPPDPPTLLLLVSFRSGPADPGSPLHTVLRSLQEAQIPGTALDLEPLAPEAALALAASLVDNPERAAEIVLEAKGNPWLIQELALPIGSSPTNRAAGHLRHLVVARSAGLPEPARDMLHLLSAAGYPLALELVRRAAHVQPQDGDLVGLLRHQHLARLRGTPRHRVLETYHDRVREAVLASLPAEALQACHLRLAQALEASRPGDVQALANHYLAAGETALAAEYSGRAALQSETGLAFDQAANLYLKAVALRAPGDARLPALRARLADALANAGRSAEAAGEYLAAAAEGAPADAPRLRRRAAEEYFRSGHVAEGLRLGQAVVAGLGLRLPATPLRAMASLLYHRLRLRLRGLGAVERPEADLPVARLDRIDALWSLAMGLGPFDLVRATDLAARHLLLALEAGEPMRLVRGLAHEAAFRAAKGTRNAGQARRLLARTLALAARIDQPEALARGQLAAAIAAMANGQWRSAMVWADQAEATLQQGCAGVAYELHTARFFSLWNAMLIGDFPDVQRRFPGLLQEARRQNDLLMSTNLQVVIGGMLGLVADDPARAHRQLDQGMADWPRETFLLQHMQCLSGRTNILLYQERAAEALALVERQWRALDRSFLLDAQAIRVTALEMRIRAMLAAGRDAGAWVRTLAREDCAYGQALALKNAAILAARAGRAAAPDRLDAAAAALGDCELHLQAQSLRRVHGSYLGGPAGLALVDQADRWMRARGIRQPARMARMLAPGLERD